MAIGHTGSADECDHALDAAPEAPDPLDECEREIEELTADLAARDRRIEELEIELAVAVGCTECGIRRHVSDGLQRALTVLTAHEIRLDDVSLPLVGTASAPYRVGYAMSAIRSALAVLGGRCAHHRVVPQTAVVQAEEPPW